MIELLDNIALLTRPGLDPRTLTLGGVRFGAPAGDVPRDRVKEALGSIVARSRVGSAVESEYFDKDERRLSMDEVIDHVVAHGGALHLVDKIGYRIHAGTVIGFSISERWLGHFSGLASYAEFKALFGEPVHVRTVDEPGGGPISYFNQYRNPSKMVLWDDWDSKVAFANLGDFEKRE